MSRALPITCLVTAELDKFSFGTTNWAGRWPSFSCRRYTEEFCAVTVAKGRSAGGKVI